MKRRTGLVSNSSSSSFLLFLEEIPKTREQVKTLLFPDNDYFVNPYKWPDDADDIPDGWSIDLVVDVILEDIENTNALTEEEIIRELCAGYLEEIEPKYDFGERDWNKYDEEKESRAKKYYEKLPKAEKVICLSYSDNDGALPQALEHGNTFDNIFHVKISHH